MMDRRFLFYPLFFLFLILTGCQPSASLQPVEQIISDIRTEYAPDKRVAIWEVSAERRGSQILLSGQSNLPGALAALEESLDNAGITWTDSIKRLPDPTLLGDEIYGIVNLSVCNIRSQAKHSGELSTQSTLGTTLKIWDRQGDWYRVQTPDGYLGWLDAGGFTRVDEAGLNDWKEAEKVIYLPETGFSYAAPEAGAPVVSDLLAGNLLRRVGQQGGFTEVAYPDGRRAFIPNSELQNFSTWLENREPSVENILAQAKKLMGRPYLWGGTSGKGMDCSGFTKTVFYLNGLILPRDASQQIHVGAEIPETDDLSALQPGDFLFFGRKATTEQPEKITHVAIYLGDSRIIHATGRVKIESLNPDHPDFAPERLKTFVRAKRMLEQPAENGIVAVAESPWY